MIGTIHNAYHGSGSAMVTQIVLMAATNPVSGAIPVDYVGVILLRQVASSPRFTTQSIMQTMRTASTPSHSPMAL